MRVWFAVLNEPFVKISIRNETISIRHCTFVALPNKTAAAYARLVVGLSNGARFLLKILT